MGNIYWKVAIIQLSLLAIGLDAVAATASNRIDLVAANGEPVPSYKAALYWNTRRVVVDPPIRAVIHTDDAKSANLVCGFQLHQRRNSPAPPVEIRLRDPIQGLGQILAKDGVDLSVYGALANATSASLDAAKAFFDFDISAFDCDSPRLRSTRVPVMLRLVEWEVPVFSQPDKYTVRFGQTVPVGSVVMRLQAKELHQSADVCRYEIENDPMVAEGGAAPAVPFAIDGSGTIRLKTPLVPTIAEQKYILRVTASDCSVPESRKAFLRVVIIATPVAAAGDAAVSAAAKAETTVAAKWLDVPDKLVYPASSGVRIFAPRAALSDLTGQCVQNSAVVKITVQSSAWDQVCERSIESLYEQRSVCQVKPASIDLLNPHYNAISGADTDTGPIKLPDCKCCEAADIAAAKLKDQIEAKRKLQKVELKEHHSFDGVQYYMDVPSDVVPSSHRLGQQFTVHFWLRHGPMAKDSDKEQILCSADESGHNRHHYSVFLHNCKLILLLRQEYDPATAGAAAESDSSLRAAEWRFRLNEICDSNWHHYAISFSGGRVKLNIDGRIFASSADNPQILDDFPMHRSTSNATRLTIGACWHGSAGVYRQFLKGSLAGLVLLRRDLESDSTIHCLNQCHEKLDFRTRTQLEPGMSVSLNADYTMIEIKGRNASEVAKLLRSIGYTNVRRAAGRGDDEAVRRSIRLDTAVTCANPKTIVSVSPVVINVDIVDPVDSAPSSSSSDLDPASAALLTDRLCIAGPNLLRYQPEDLAPPGVAFLQGLHISLRSFADSVSINNATSTSAAAADKRDLLDACVLRTSPDFTAVESLSWPAGLAADARIEGRVNRRELLLEGYAKPEVYRNLLTRVIYANVNPIIRYRTFVLTCSVPGGRIVSNEFSVKLSILHPKIAKHTVKKQLPDPPQSQSVMSDIVSLKSAASASGLSRSDGVAIGQQQQQHQHHLAEGHGARAGSQLLVEQQHQLHQLQADQINSTPWAPIIIGLSTACLLLVALGLMYRRYQRAMQLLPVSSGAAAVSGRNGKTLPVDAESQAEMEWDNTALNITVNPLDNETDSDDAESAPVDEEPLVSSGRHTRNPIAAETDRPTAKSNDE